MFGVMSLLERLWRVSKAFLSCPRPRKRPEAKLHCAFIDLFSLLTRYLVRNNTFAERGTELLSPSLTSDPVQSLPRWRVIPALPWTPLSSTSLPWGHLSRGDGRGLKYFLLKPGQCNIAFGGSPNHAYKRCNKWPELTNIRVKHLILWALLQHASWTRRLPLSFVFTDTTVSLGQAFM